MNSKKIISLKLNKIKKITFYLKTAFNTSTNLTELFVNTKYSFKIEINDIYGESIRTSNSQDLQSILIEIHFYFK